VLGDAVDTVLEIVVVDADVLVDVMLVVTWIYSISTPEGEGGRRLSIIV